MAADWFGLTVLCTLAVLQKPMQIRWVDIWVAQCWTKQTQWSDHPGQRQHVQCLLVENLKIWMSFTPSHFTGPMAVSEPYLFYFWRKWLPWKVDCIALYPTMVPLLPNLHSLRLHPQISSDCWFCSWQSYTRSIIVTGGSSIWIRLATSSPVARNFWVERHGQGMG